MHTKLVLLAETFYIDSFSFELEIIDGKYSKSFSLFTNFISKTAIFWLVDNIKIHPNNLVNKECGCSSEYT